MTNFDKTMIGLIFTVVFFTIVFSTSSLLKLTGYERTVKQSATATVQLNNNSTVFTVRITEKLETSNSLLPIKILEKLSVVESSAALARYTGTFSKSEVEELIIPAIRYNMTVEVIPVL